MVGQLEFILKNPRSSGNEIKWIEKRPLDEIRDFSFARQAIKELEAGR